MFRSIWTKTLRDYRLPIIGWGLMMVLICVAAYKAVESVLGDAAGRAGIMELTYTFRFFAEPVAVTTPNGFVTWRSFSFFPIVLSIWAVFAGSALIRRDEERQSLDLILSTAQNRLGVLIQKTFSLALAFSLVGLFIAGGIMLGQKSSNLTVDPIRALFAGLNVSLLAFFYGMLGLFFSQFFRERTTAAALTGVAVVLSFLLDATGRVVADTQWIQKFSPFYYSNINKPLITDYPASWLEPALLLAVALLLLTVSGWLFIRRDIGGVVFPSFGQGREKPIAQQMTRAQHSIFNTSTGLRALRNRLGPSLWWLISMALFFFWMTLMIPSVKDSFESIIQSSPFFKSIFSREGYGDKMLLASMVFQLGTVLLFIFSIMQGMNWITDVESGRMELVLATPVSRSRLLLERATSALFLLALTPLMTWGMIIFAGWLSNFSVDSNAIAAMAWAILPVQLMLFGVMVLLAGWLSGGTVMAIMITYLLSAFMLEMFQGLLNLPDWVRQLSIFYTIAHPSPLLDGWQWGTMGIFSAIALVCFLLGLWRFRHIDLQRG